MRDAEKLSPKKLESMLEVTPQEVADTVGKDRSNIYATYRNKNIPFYRVILLGMRVIKSNLTIKEFLRMLKDAESLKAAK